VGANLRAALLGSALWVVTSVATATGALELSLIPGLGSGPPASGSRSSSSRRSTSTSPGSQRLQIGGALLLSAGVWIVAGLTLAVVRPLTSSRAARILLTVSALSVVGPMVLAVFWAAGQHYDLPALDTPAMAAHGTVNAFGFSLAGLLGWVARDRGST
jgi:hypothetical protein